MNVSPQNGELAALPEPSKPTGNYTGERLKVLRPQTYRRVVELLAEPREHLSIREICRQCHVTDDTVKAVEKREAMSIAARKQELAVQAARIAKLAYDRVEDQIGTAPLPQAVVTAGVFTDKFQLRSLQSFAISRWQSRGSIPAQPFNGPLNFSRSFSTVLGFFAARPRNSTQRSANPK
jgi:predicted Zn-ribbon and HTH transcriptional regulator